MGKNFITRKEVCELLHISKVTLWRHTKEGTLTSYGIGGRVLYCKDEVITSVVELKSIRDEK